MIAPPWKNQPSHGLLQAIEGYLKGFIGLNGKDGKESLNKNIAGNLDIVKLKKAVKNKLVITVCYNLIEIVFLYNRRNNVPRIPCAKL